MNNNLPANFDKNFTSKLLTRIREYCSAGAEGITGVIASEKKDKVLTVGRLFQGLLNLEFLDTLNYEWNDYRSKGRIQDDYQQSEQHHACLQEMLDFLDADKPDKTRFEFMKKIFLSAATETVENRESILPQQYMYIARQMTSGDVLLLNGLYDMYNTKTFNSTNSLIDKWVIDVASNTPLKHTSLVLFHEKHLIELGIVDDRVGGDRKAIGRAPYNRLTTFALSLCEFIRHYDKLSIVR